MYAAVSSTACSVACRAIAVSESKRVSSAYSTCGWTAASGMEKAKCGGNLAEASLMILS